jgi:serine/threonine-protein kinase TNNI3K
MELMDDSLTHFLESSPQPIPYHIQVNVCHDITRALSFLHSNGIVHRDLSSNNVLLIGNIRAKLTDFGMARLGDLNPQATRFTNTMCPGTDVYMPPEAVQDKPVYTEKIDCFSFGVIAIQTMTQEFPKPGDRQITINDPRYPRPIKMNIPEIERRQNHIHEVDPNHPLLPISLNCLKDADDARPSAQQLCQRIAALKKTDKYKNASEGVKNACGDCKEREHEQIQRLQQKIGS